MTTNPTITQADRDEAARFISPMAKPSQLSVRIGEADDIDLVQAFARHREQAVAEKDAEIARLREISLDLAASLAAALSILQRANEEKKQPRLVVASDKMFSVMMADYQKSLDRAREALRQPKEQDDGE